MDAALYEFPPPVWENQDWSVASVLMIVVFGLIVPLAVAWRSKPTTAWIICWTGVTVLAAASLSPSYGDRNATWDPFWHQSLLPLLLAFVGIGTLSVLVTKWLRKKTAEVILFGLVFILLLGAAVVGPSGVTTYRSSSQRQQCKNNLKQLGLGMWNYHDQYESFPNASTGPVPVSWRVTLLPFIEGKDLWQRYDRTQPWDAAVNEPLQKIHARAYDCPSGPPNFDSAGRFLTSYVVPTSPGSIFADGVGSGVKTITDGTSNTLLVVESCNSRIIWTEPRDGDNSPAAISINQPGREKGLSSSLLSSWHSGGTQVALADGSVRFLSNDTDPALLKKLMSKDLDWRDGLSY